MKMKYLLVTVLVSVLFAGLTGCGDRPNTRQDNGHSTMKRRIINPWTWQNTRGFVQSNEITGAKRMLFTAGIVSVDGEGNLLHGGNMEKQINKVIDNLEVLLGEANFKLSDVIRFTYYTTDVQAFTNAAKQVLIERLKRAGCRPATSLIGVQSLFHPECVVEIEGIAVD